jgi:thiol-disulfide isomerase/thioredoxin
MTESPQPPTPPPSDGKHAVRLFAPHLAIFLVALVAGAGGVLYALNRPGKESGAAACPAASIAAAQRLAPLAKGEMAAFNIPAVPRPAPDLAFDGPDGQPTRLSAMRGKALLVNLWATWCPPCRKEMPSLDALERDQGGPGFSVVAISLDTRALEKRQQFLDQIGAKNIKLYGDPKGLILPQMKAASGVLGLPTTLLVDAAGCQLGVLQGEAKWDSEDARTLMKAASGS